MKQRILFGAIDVDDKNFHIALVSTESPEVIQWSCKATSSHLLKKLKDLEAKQCTIRLCYEATYLGFSLYRRLTKEGVDVEVIAPSLIPEVRGPKVKTDRLDCLKLARLYSQGLLTAIHVPQEDEEAVRDLIRSRHFLGQQIKATKLHLLSLFRRKGIHYREEHPNSAYWTQMHLKWIEAQIKQVEDQVFKMNVELLKYSLDHLHQQVAFYDSEITNISETPRYAKPCRSLMCYRGIDRLTAMKIITEIGDIRRFDHPYRLTSYLGLDLVEYSSGGKSNRFGITKMGNAVLRTAVIEACQTAHFPNRISRDLGARRSLATPQAIDIADRCMRRLYKRSHHLMIRGKHRNKVKVACARELLGFIWESLHKAA